MAKSLGESLFYNDNDLYLAAKKMAEDCFGSNELTILTASQKLELAKRLRFSYNAGDKQLQRLLKIDSDVIKVLF